MADNTQTTKPAGVQSTANWLHVAAVALIIACVVLSQTLLKGNKELAGTMLAVATFLWGKLGFLPDISIIRKFLQQIAPQEVAQLAALPEPMKTAITVIQQKANSMPPGATEETSIPVKIVGNSNIPREFIATPETDEEHVSG